MKTAVAKNQLIQRLLKASVKRQNLQIQPKPQIHADQILKQTAPKINLSEIPLYDRTFYKIQDHPLLSNDEDVQIKLQTASGIQIKGGPQSYVHLGTHYEFSVLKQLEELCPDQLQFRLKCCGGRNDGGVDLWGFLTVDKVQFRFLCQCKRISKKLSVSTVRDFESTISRLQDDSDIIQNFVLSRKNKTAIIDNQKFDFSQSTYHGEWSDQIPLLGAIASTTNLSRVAYNHFMEIKYPSLFIWLSHNTNSSVENNSGFILQSLLLNKTGQDLYPKLSDLLKQIIKVQQLNQ